MKASLVHKTVNNDVIDQLIALREDNPKARANPRALAQLEGYKRRLVSSLSGNIQRFGMERVARIESLQEIIAEMSETENPQGSLTITCQKVLDMR